MKVDTDLDINFQEAKEVFDKIMQRTEHRGFLVRNEEAKKFEEGSEEGALEEQDEESILKQLERD